jgi:bifunctional non-homologous end joining protein LigD
VFCPPASSRPVFRLKPKSRPCELWWHEIKHDGFRVIARKTDNQIRLYSRPRNDGEAVVCDDKGVPSFDRIPYRRHDSTTFLYAFDLIELDGDDLRREPIEHRKVLLIRLLAKAPVVGLQVNDHIVEPGDVVFRHACQIGFEGIVSKRLGSPYVSGRSRHWIKNKNPQHPAVKREAEEDWGKEKWR